MFVMFINDLINTLEEFGVSAKLFAYDVKMYVRVLSNCDVSRLQRARSMHQQIGQICGSCQFLSANALLWTLEKVQYHWIAYRNNVLNVLGRMLIWA